MTDPVDPDVLITLTRACRDGERLRAGYRDRHDRESERLLEPYRVVTTARRWYLVARDVERDEWRTLRVDRLQRVEPTGHRVQITDPPDPVALVQEAITTAPYRYQAEIELRAPLAAVADAVPPTVATLEAIDGATTLLTTGGDRLDWLALHLLALDVDFTVRRPPELVTQLRQLHERLTRLVRDWRRSRRVGCGHERLQRGRHPVDRRRPRPRWSPRACRSTCTRPRKRS